MDNNLTGIESAFITEWSGWDELDTGVLGFYNPVLKPEISSTLSLHSIDFLVVDTQKNRVDFYCGEDSQSFKLNVSLGDPVL